MKKTQPHKKQVNDFSFFNKTSSYKVINDFTSLTEDEIINQKSINSVEHTVKEQYQILSKNDFGKTNRINVGIFNKKTDFRVSPKDSLMVINKDTMKISAPDIKIIKKNPEKYFMLYNHLHMLPIWNKDITIKFQDIPDTDFNIDLTFKFGEIIGDVLIKISDLIKAGNSITSFDDIPINIDESRLKIISTIININKNKLNINKKILTNSNPNFLMGILNGIFDINNKRFFKVPDSINIYSISIILNLLGASYSIRKDKDHFIVRFKLPNSLNITELNNDIFRKYKYIIRNNKIVLEKSDLINITKNDIDSGLDQDIIDIYKKINENYIELLPCTDIVFNLIKDDKPMYDLVMENMNAHNFNLGGLPLLHNSDGDILAVIGLFSKESIKQARENFSAENKLKFKSSLDGSVQNFGVKTDAALGLYNSTK